MAVADFPISHKSGTHSFSLTAVDMYLGFLLAIFRDAAGHGLLDTGHIYQIGF